MNTDTLEARLRKLEKQNRLLTTSLLLGVLLVACTSAMIVKQGSLFSSEVRANRFVLIDSNDKEIGFWETSKGLPRFVFGSNASSPAVYLVENTKDAALILRSPNSSQASITSRDEKGSVSLTGGNGVEDGSVNIGGGVISGMTIVGSKKGKYVLAPSATEIARYEDTKGKTRFQWTPTTLFMNGENLIFGDINGKPILTLPNKP